MKSSDGENLKSEKSSRKWHAKNRTESSGHTGHQERSSFRSVHFKDVSQLICNRATHLNCCPFATSRAAENVREDSSEKNERRHPKRNDRLRIVKLINDKIVAAFNRSSPKVVSAAHDETT